MSATGRILVVEDPRYQSHRGPTGHPERPERLAAVGAALDDFGARLERSGPRLAEAEEILRVHRREHLTRVAATAGRGHGNLDPDTYVCDESYETALLAAGGSIDLARSVARGEARAGLAAVRPPGHHAEPDRAMGFCLFNNIAIAARALQEEEGLDRILIIDWDVHHGNGTQHFFESDPSVLYLSTHQYPYYPGTGAAREVGLGAGEGATVNVPMPAGCGDTEYVGVLQRLVVPVAHGFRPQMILISCGFDAHRDDPIASMQVSKAGFKGMTQIVRALADDLCDGRLAFVLEGGYSALGLREGTGALMEALLDDGPTALPPATPLHPGSALRQIVDAVTSVHAHRFQSPGAA